MARGVAGIPPPTRGSTRLGLLGGRYSVPVFPQFCALAVTVGGAVGWDHFAGPTAPGRRRWRHPPTQGSTSSVHRSAFCGRKKPW